MLRSTQIAWEPWWNAEADSAGLGQGLGFFISLLFYHWIFYFLKLLFIEFMGVTLVNKIIQVSSVQLYNTKPSVYCTVCSTLSQIFYHHFPPLPSCTSLHLLFPSDNPPVLSVSVSLRCFFCWIPSPFSPNSPNAFPSDSCQSVLCISESVSILFVSLLSSLYSTFK